MSRPPRDDRGPAVGPALPHGWSRRWHHAPRKLLWKIDPGGRRTRAPRLRTACGRLGHEWQDDDNRDGCAILGRAAPGLEQRRCKPARRARFRSPQRAMRSWVCSRWTRRRCRRWSPVRSRARWLGNLFRDQLDRYGELEHVAERWSDAVAGFPRSTTLVVNADDPLVGGLAEGGVRRFDSASTTRDMRARLCNTPPTRSTASLRHSVRVRRGVCRPSRRLPLPSLRARPPTARVVAADIELRGRRVVQARCTGR